MSGKNSKQNKKVAPVAPVETPVAPVETPVAPAQKGGKRGGKKPTVEAPVVAHVVAPVEAPVAQKGGRKPKAAAKVIPVNTTVEVAPAQKGGRKVTVKVVAKDETIETKPAPKTGAKKLTAKKVAAPKTPKAAAPKEDADAEETNETNEDRRVRSFKVQLPGTDVFNGRFTGLTPYQAANKALSKYFRETEQPALEIEFSICESTRKSKKSTYTYIGRRQKLDVPVTYKIADGREIVKNFKNSLKKVKKLNAKAVPVTTDA